MPKCGFIFGLIFSLAFSFCRVAAGSGIFTYEKIFFTQNGLPTGTPLVHDFEWSSCWFALGNDDSGNIYVAISNEIDPDGDVAIFKYDPVLNQMTFINDLKSVSTAAGNWLPNENQQKVHNRLLRGADGRLYFGTHDDSWGTLTDHRGTHIYALGSNSFTDLSASETQYLNSSMQTVQGNIGVHVQNYGTIGMEMTRGTPRLLYGVTYGDGYFYRLNLDTGDIKMIAHTGQGYSTGIIRNFALDTNGSAYVPMQGTNAGNIRIYKYDNTAGTWAYTGKFFTDTHFLAGEDPDKSGWRLHVYTQAGDMVYFIAYDGSIYRLTFATLSLQYLGVLEPDPNPTVSDLILSDDEHHLYALVYKYGIDQHKFVDFNIQTGVATTVDSDISTYGARDLIYGGLARDKLGHAYMVGWEYQNTSITNIALFKINVEPTPTLAFRPAGGKVALAWNIGALQQTSNAVSPWADVTNALTPMLVQPLLPWQFFRVRY